MTEKMHYLETLKEVSRLLPSGQNLDNEVVQKVRSSLDDHIATSRSKRSMGYEVDDVSIDINFTFECIPQNDFNDYPLTVEDITIRKFIQNRGSSRDRDEALKGTNSTGGSIRLIAAFLIVSDTNSLTLDNLISTNLSNYTARYLSEFFDSDDSEGLPFEAIEGIYHSQWDSGSGNSDTIQLTFERSADGTHFLVEEKYSAELKTQENFKSVKTAYGWCIVTSSDVLLIGLRNPVSEAAYLYMSLHVQLDENPTPSTESIVFHLQNWHFDECAVSSDVLSHSKFDVFLKKHQFVFSKVRGDILTFEKPFDAITRRRNWSEMRGMDTRRSSAENVVTIKRKEDFMDEEEKEKLSREMLDCIVDIANKDELRFFELLNMGASINYCHPKYGYTTMHAVGQFYPEFFEEVLKRSHEEYDFLTRDRNGRLASGWAFFNWPENPLYELMRTHEIEYGKAQGIYPDSIKDRPLDEVFPDGYFGPETTP